MSDFFEDSRGIARHDDTANSMSIDNSCLNSPQLPFVVDEQRVTIHRVDFSNRTIFATTELDVRIHFGYPGVKCGSIALNLRQAAITTVRIDGEAVTTFTYSDPWTLCDGVTEEDGEDEALPKDCSELEQRMLQAAESADYENGNGELWITNIIRPHVDDSDIDTDVEEDRAYLEWSSVTISIDYVLEQPQNGVVFVLPRGG